MPAFLIPMAIGGASSIIGSILGGSARKAQEKMINAESKRNDDMFRNDYYKNQLDRTENLAALQKAHKYLKERAGIDAKTAAVTGATPEAVAANRKANMSSYSDLIGNIAAQGSAVRDRIRDRYEANRSNIFNMRNGLAANKVQQYGNLVSNGIGLAANSAMGMAGVPAGTTAGTVAKTAGKPMEWTVV
ncbi:MAG: hypothetical protein LBR26_09840 [Prevotella sp.]|jgi:membrane protein involved in colicin uptake|nr:hypothetical protein [Prevotella sp.]